MKFLVPYNYSCLQNGWLGGYRLQIPVLSVLNWICWTPPPWEHNSWVRHCCRQVVKRGGVCIFVHKYLNYTTVDLDKYCKDQDIEACSLKLESYSFIACIMAVSRAPMGNFNLFLNGLDGIIMTLYKVDLKLIICGSFIHFTFHWSYTDVELVMYTFSIINKASVHT